MKKKLIGVYDYTVVLTLLSLVVSILGMTQAMNSHFRTAVTCLALSGFLDTFDGKVARTKKDRTKDEQLYGIQLDSLADVVCFGVFPVLICYLCGVRGIIGMFALAFYGMCGVIRLAYFNVLETNRQLSPTNEEKVFHGLPITSISVILPLIFLLQFACSEEVFCYILTAMLLIVGTCFIVNFKMKKPKNWQIAVLIVVVGTAVGLILFFSRYQIPKLTSYEEPLEDIVEMIE